MRIILICLALGAVTSDAPNPSSGLDETRSFHANGRLAEVRHFRDGREEGLQQAWTADGTLYINYEMRHGQRHGLMNARPCNPVEDAR